MKSFLMDDGSRDGTLKELRELAAAHTREAAQVRYLSFSRNFGKEAAMLAGLREATGDYLVLMDADLQHPPTLLPRMYRILRDSGGALDLCGRAPPRPCGRRQNPRLPVARIL